MESSHRPTCILRCKVVLVGDAATGKSALTQVFSSGGATYPKGYVMTVGADFVVKQIPIPDTNTVVELYLFDCAGQSIFNQVEMNSKYYQDAAAVMCVFDIGDLKSFQACGKWLTGTS
jgi:transport family protein 27